MTVVVDTSQWDAALRQYLKLTQRTIREVLNQRAVNIARHGLDVLPPRNIDQQRARVRAYLSEKLSEQKTKIAKSGKRKGQRIKNYQKALPWNLTKDQRKELADLITQPRKQDPRKAYPRNNFKGKLEARIRTHANRAHRLERANLILQARRAKMGLPGLYGYEMWNRTAKFKRVMATSVTYLQTPFAWMIRQMNKFVRWKVPYGRLLKIATWPGSGSSKSQAIPAGTPWAPALIWAMSLKLRGPGISRATRYLKNALQIGVTMDAIDMEKRVRDQLQREANLFNARKAA